MIVTVIVVVVMIIVIIRIIAQFVHDITGESGRVFLD